MNSLILTISLLSTSAKFEAAFNQFIADDPAKCVEISELKNTQTPVDIAHGILECYKHKELHKGARLLISMLIYNAYDEKRVNPYYANQSHRIIQQLIKQYFPTEQELATFKKVLDEEELKEAELCGAITERGKPNYIPRYFVNTKSNAQQPIEHTLVPDFDGDKVWQQLLDRFDNCSTLNNDTTKNTKL